MNYRYDKVVYIVTCSCVTMIQYAKLMISNHQCHPAQRKILISPCTNGLKTWTKRKLL